jgi:hypothetical protein
VSGGKRVWQTRKIVHTWRNSRCKDASSSRTLCVMMILCVMMMLNKHSLQPSHSFFQSVPGQRRPGDSQAASPRPVTPNTGLSECSQWQRLRDSYQ